jgi:hypothetical protein
METPQENNDDIIYHIEPEEVMRLHPELVGKVKQSYIFCKACNQWKKMTARNSMTISIYEMSLKKQNYVSKNSSCMTDECMKEQENIQREKEEEARFWDRVEWHEARIKEAEKRCEEGRIRRGEHLFFVDKEKKDS